MVQRFLLATLLVAASCLFVAKAYGADTDEYGYTKSSGAESAPSIGQKGTTLPPAASTSSAAPTTSSTTTNPATSTTFNPANNDVAPVTNNDPTLKSEATKAQTQATVQMLGAAAGAAFLVYQCVTTWPAGMASCAAAVPLVIQAINIFDYKKQADPITGSTIANTQSGTTPDKSGFAALNSIGAESPNYPAPAGYGTLKQITDKLASKGFVTKDGKTTLPNGKTVPTSSLATSSGLASAGFDGNAAKYAQSVYDREKDKVAAALAKTAKGSSGDADGGSGGSRYSGNPSASQDSINYAMLSMGRSGAGSSRGLASVAGASRKLGADNIGVSADNIFQMIQRRYDKKRQLKQFIE